MKKVPTRDEAIKKFRNFVTFRNKISIFLSLVIIVLYYLFTIGIGAFPNLLGFSIGPSSISVGIVYGLALIIISVISTGLYTFFANQHFDKVQKEILEDLQDSGALKDLQDGKV
ncbi:DUF485 domain protein [Campylobacter avium LMG 24591]|uniref:DUF485 domain protein n=1 Tax=Campylobacter avium LMG 24591 TaxID=522484 RepID=A0A222MWT2_9BACT|nr:DUF485 domain-containing protein [Campylobacter avium]ASQ30527.1 DUF485 domain protein [Campylobacter avium LMG 24591]OYD79624.1 hypothetical protein CAV8706_0869 [Campylobacter avium]HJE65995.1 DUF485 domain-containing protein [Campylobacter avium]